MKDGLEEVTSWLQELEGMIQALPRTPAEVKR